MLAERNAVYEISRFVLDLGEAVFGSAQRSSKERKALESPGNYFQAALQANNPLYDKGVCTLSVGRYERDR